MPWPMSQDYNEAVQNPTSCFADPELQQTAARCNAIGLPMPRSGNFADVYEMVGPAGQKWAVKCFTRQVAGLRERYAAISAYLKHVDLPFMVDFSYLEQGIQVKGQWYPILKMDWVEGFTLNEFIGQNADNPSLLEATAHLWLKLARRLREARMAHCDLQHGNVLLVPGKRDGALGVRLIDYDGMFVPALANTRSGEVGHPAFQHPQRLRDGTYNAEVDRFPHLVIYTALRSLMIGSRYLWNKYDNGDNLLFKQADLETPARSPLFQELLKLGDEPLRRLLQGLSQSVHKPVEATPLLDDLVPGGGAITSAPRRPGMAATAPAGPGLSGRQGVKRRRNGLRNVAAVVLLGAAALAILVMAGIVPGLHRKPPESRTQVAVAPPPPVTTAKATEVPPPKPNADPIPDPNPKEPEARPKEPEPKPKEPEPKPSEPEPKPKEPEPKPKEPEPKPKEPEPKPKEPEPKPKEPEPKPKEPEPKPKEPEPKPKEPEPKPKEPEPKPKEPEPKGPEPKPKEPDPKPEDALKPFAVGKWVDLVRYANPAKHALTGDWLKGDTNELQVLKGGRLPLPVAVRGSYDFSFEFTRTSGNELVGVQLPVDRRACGVWLSWAQGRAHGIQFVNGKDLGDRANLTAVRPGPLTNNKRHQCTVQVRLLPKDQATIAVLLDKKPLTRWRGAVGSLSHWSGVSLPNSAYPTLWAFQDPVLFHRVLLARMSEATEVAPLAAAATDGYPVGEKAAEPPAKIKPDAVQRGKHWYWFNEQPLDYPEAQALARSLGGRLLVIKSQEEQAFIVPRLKGEYTWLGLVRRHKSRSYLNDRFQEHTFFRWDRFQPKMGDPDILMVVHRNGGWHDSAFWGVFHACVMWGPE